jgi:hypothetical protein
MDTFTKIERIIRHSPPTEHDQLEKGTIAEVHLSDNEIEPYEQISEDTNKPNWVMRS